MIPNNNGVIGPGEQNQFPKLWVGAEGLKHSIMLLNPVLSLL